jgi:hypothetical protein
LQTVCVAFLRVTGKRKSSVHSQHHMAEKSWNTKRAGLSMALGGTIGLVLYQLHEQQ